MLYKENLLWLINQFKFYRKEIKSNNYVNEKCANEILSYKCKISIIIPVYNAEKYLRKCLDSVINQTLKEIEIICINDGSTDLSLSILKKYATCDNRIKIINQENQGVAIARNNGLKYATGEYIGYVDSDDYVSSIFFELLYNNAKKYNADIACGEIRRPNAESAQERNFFVINKMQVTKKVRIKYK